MNKYNAKKTTVDGIKFDSKREAKRYGELKLWEKSGGINRLRVHPSWDLIVNEVFIGRYTADFVYHTWADVLVVEDVKSPATAKRADYRLRKRLMLALHGIEIEEVL